MESRYCSSDRVSSPALVTTTATTAAAVMIAGHRNRPSDRLRGLGWSSIMWDLRNDGRYRRSGGYKGGRPPLLFDGGGRGGT